RRVRRPRRMPAPHRAACRATARRRQPLPRHAALRADGCDAVPVRRRRLALRLVGRPDPERPRDGADRRADLHLPGAPGEDGVVTMHAAAPPVAAIAGRSRRNYVIPTLALLALATTVGTLGLRAVRLPIPHSTMALLGPGS